MVDWHITSAVNGVVKLFKPIPSGFCQHHKRNTIPFRQFGQVKSVASKRRKEIIVNTKVMAGNDLTRAKGNSSKNDNIVTKITTTEKYINIFLS